MSYVEIQHPQYRRQSQEWDNMKNIAPSKTLAFPPKPEQQRHRERRRDRLAQHRAHNQDQCRAVSPPLLAGVESQKGQERQQIEERRQYVFPFDHPCHGLHMYGVEDENCRGRPCARDFPRPEDPPHQHSVHPVQKNVHEMIPQGRGAPESILRPECGIQTRPVVRFPRRICRWVGPNRPKSAERIHKRVFSQ